MKFINKKTVVFIFIPLVLVLLIIGIFIYKSSMVKPNDNSLENELLYAQNNTGNQPLKNISRYISAELPEGWSLYEFEKPRDGEGDLTKYNGLFELEILNDKDKRIFTMANALGLGGRSGCSVIYKFSDTEQSYVDSKKQVNEAYNVKYTEETISASYSEVKLFGKDMRRVGTKLYKNTSTTQGVFNPECSDVESNIVELTTVAAMFSDASLDKSHYYTWEIPGDLTEGEYTALDKILNSLKEE